MSAYEYRAWCDKQKEKMQLSSLLTDNALSSPYGEEGKRTTSPELENSPDAAHDESFVVTSIGYNGSTNDRGDTTASTEEIDGNFDLYHKTVSTIARTNLEPASNNHEPYGKSACSLQGNGCLLCERGPPWPANYIPTWLEIGALLFACLQRGQPETVFFDVKHEIKDFVESHFYVLRIDRKANKEWRKRFQEMIGKNDHLFFMDPSPFVSQKTRWRARITFDPWKQSPSKGKWLPATHEPSDNQKKEHHKNYRRLGLFEPRKKPRTSYGANDNIKCDTDKVYQKPRKTDAERQRLVALYQQDAIGSVSKNELIATAAMIAESRFEYDTTNDTIVALTDHSQLTRALIPSSSLSHMSHVLALPPSLLLESPPSPPASFQPLPAVAPSPPPSPPKYPNATACVHQVPLDWSPSQVVADASNSTTTESEIPRSDPLCTTTTNDQVQDTAFGNAEYCTYNDHFYETPSITKTVVATIPSLDTFESSSEMQATINTSALALLREEKEEIHRKHHQQEQQQQQKQLCQEREQYQEQKREQEWEHQRGYEYEGEQQKTFCDTLQRQWVLREQERLHSHSQLQFQSQSYHYYQQQQQFQELRRLQQYQPNHQHQSEFGSATAMPTFTTTMTTMPMSSETPSTTFSMPLVSMKDLYSDSQAFYSILYIPWPNFSSQVPPWHEP